MTDDRAKTGKESRAGKAKGRLQRFPEIRQLARTTNAVGVAQSIFRQFADDIQLKDLLAKAEAFANSNLGLPKAGSKDAPPAQTFRDATPANESARKAGAKKTPAKAARPKKAVPKKTPSKKKKPPAPKRKVKPRS